MKRPQYLRRPAAWMVAFAMILTLLPPVTLTAHALTYYNIHIGSTQFTSGNLTITDTNGGTATFDPDTNTLTLTDFTYEGTGFRGNTIDDEAAIYSLLDDLTILLSGSNVLTHVTNEDDAPAFSFGLYSSGPVTIDVLPGAEYGELVLNGGTSPKYSYGLKTDKSLIVNGGTLDATGGEGPYSTGIYTGYNLVVHDGMVLAGCKAATSLSYGINSYAYDKDNAAYNGGIYVSGGTVYARTAEAPTAIAMNSNHAITITDGFVSAVGGTAENGSCGMAASLISVQGGEVVATGGTASDSSCGIIAGDIFRMEGGKLTATAGETELGYGIAAQNGIEISSGTVTAQGIGGAMTHAPMADSYDHFSFWYGADEASAMDAGVKPGSYIPDYCGKPYVHFTDDSGDTGTDTPELTDLTFSEAFPDPVFRAYVTDTVLTGNTEDKSDDAVITDNQMAIIESCTEVSLYGETTLTSLQGIEYFTALVDLNCGNTGITTLDVSKNTTLIDLTCSSTAIAELDVSHCTALESLYFNNTLIRTIDLSKNTALLYLDCNSSAITALDVRANPALIVLDCRNTSIEILDISRNSRLEVLAFWDTALPGIDLHSSSITGYDYTGMDLYPTKTDVPIIPTGNVWTLDMAAFLGDSGDVQYVTMTDGGVLENGIVTYTTKPETVTYTYDTGMGIMDVTWEPVFGEPVVTGHSHCECGKASCTDNTHVAIHYEPLVDASITDLTEGSYVLTGDLAMDNELLITGSVHLCLNGHTLDLSDQCVGIYNGSLTICDCTGGGTITSMTEYSTLRLYEGTADLTVYGGAITAANANSSFAIAIQNYGSGDIRIYGGTITGNRIGLIHGGTGTILLDGGTIEGQTFAGISIDSSADHFGTVTIKNGTVIGSSHGLIVTGACKDGTVSIEGGNIYGELNGVRNISQKGTVRVSGGTIGKLGDSISSYGFFTSSETITEVLNGNIYGEYGFLMYENSSIIISGGLIVGNYGIASGSVYNTFKIAGGAIDGTTADIYMQGGSDTLEAAPISLEGYTTPLSVEIRTPVTNQYIAKDVASDNLITTQLEGCLDLRYEPEHGAVRIAEIHAHGTVSFEWPSDLSWAKTQVYCQTCSETLTADAELSWSNATSGKLVLTAEAVIDGTPYSTTLEFQVYNYNGKQTIPLPIGTLDLYMVAAGYNEAGQMIECQMAETGMGDVIFTLTASDIRIYLLDQNYCPISPAMIV